MPDTVWCSVVCCLLRYLLSVTWQRLMASNRLSEAIAVEQAGLYCTKSGRGHLHPPASPCGEILGGDGVSNEAGTVGVGPG